MAAPRKRPFNLSSGEGVRSRWVSAAASPNDDVGREEAQGNIWNFGKPYAVLYRERALPLQHIGTQKPHLGMHLIEVQEMSGI
jgi:hypothetical protein